MQGHDAPPGYRVTRRLGSDASAMYLAHEDATGLPVTLRFIDVPHQGVYEAVLAIAPALRAVDHPHVIPFLDLLEAPGGGLVAVLGAAEGGSLAGILGARGTLPAGEVVTACAPVADGLSEVHRRGLLHGDVTLDDLVFTLDGKPMITGIGLVQCGVPLRAGQFARPIPPEIQAGGPAGPPADVYGLVTAATVALTGYLPSARPSLPGVAPAAEAILVAALDANPHRRPNAANVGNALFAIADPEPVELVASEGHLTTGSMPKIETVQAAPEDDIAAYMSRSTSTGRRARRRAEAAGGHTTERPVTPAAEPSAPGPMSGAPGPMGGGPADTGNLPRRGRRQGVAGSGPGAPLEAPRQPLLPPVDASSRRETRPLGSAVSGAAAAGGSGSSATGGSATGGGGAGGGGTSRRSAKGGASAPDGEPSGLRRRFGKIDGIWIVSAVVAVLLVAGAVIVGIQMFDGDDPLPDAGTGSSPSDPGASTELCGGPQPAPTAGPPAVTDWTPEVQRLYSLRAQAYEELDPALLCQVFAPTSAALAEDAATLQEYADSGVRPEGLAFEVVTAELVSQNGGQVELSITDRIPNYQLVDDDGDVVEEKDGTEQQTWTGELVVVADEAGGAPSWRFG